jgi:hypothetical protein
MSNQIPNEPKVRAEEPELNDEALEQVAGGCQWGCSADSGMIGTIDTTGTIKTISTISQTPSIEPNHM